ncbi:prepilin-type N-terminal cleavage/methylation domain-containing protein [Alicyclobacillus hesperidum]|uniref:Prepilin-type N-terminal cleavage/methylation domain-containing protein n=1 Tax=Alicyclobacillus hesperidum TaxID=89784 RepID=A0A1H2T6R8_9BACL|nr:prepilin-type N-terminal cleavage/methylation domain-containing protein [Alicyclobacillus hesperidum]SDW39520.1 prepilin-type N-terminal cleavage/methylation domain-containing protein [Alicyclobacillus hesperidum]
MVPVKQHSPFRHDAAAFTLFEMMVAVALMSVGILFAAGAGIGMIRGSELDVGAYQLLEQMRMVQTLAATSGTFATVWLDPYDTRYHLTHGVVTIEQDEFPPGIHYVDGYLAFPVHEISYDNLGDAQAAGVIRMTDGPDERDIHLYMGSGLQAAGWIDS